ncbi:hypothetical protein BU17DRAFT_103916 [Hysterangium stoloniferum]|nr:hypothetical protein BU17DRAFT_103916 [Hysterangium stoloniferum]
MCPLRSARGWLRRRICTTGRIVDTEESISSRGGAEAAGKVAVDLALAEPETEVLGASLWELRKRGRLPYSKHLESDSTIWSLYLKETREEDKELATSLQVGVDELLIFAGFVWNHSYRALQNPLAVTTSQPFQVSKSSLVVNYLSFTTLGLTLFSALCAVLAFRAAIAPAIPDIIALLDDSDHCVRSSIVSALAKFSEQALGMPFLAFIGLGKHFTPAKLPAPVALAIPDIIALFKETDDFIPSNPTYALPKLSEQAQFQLAIVDHIPDIVILLLHSGTCAQLHAKLALELSEPGAVPVIQWEHT